MTKLPWFQFEPASWLCDIHLSQCSLAAQGAWLRLLCYAHTCEPRGVLASNGKPWAEDRLHRAIGGSPTKAKALVAELEDAGVFSRRDDGAIYSRRMVRDEEFRAKCSAAGRKGGGNPTFKGMDKGSDKGSDKPTFDDTSKAEKRREEEEEEKSAPQPPKGAGAGGAIASRLGLGNEAQGVPPADLVAHWAEVVADASVRKPGAVLAKRIREGVPSPKLTTRGVIAACKAGMVLEINGVPIAGKKLTHNSRGLHLDDALFVPTDKLGEAVFS